MAEENPNLIPLPSIGQSASSKSVDAVPHKGSKLWLIVLLCVVVGVGLGIFVYQQSITTKPSPSLKPVASRAPVSSPSPLPSPSPVVPEVNVVSPQSNRITMPKTGQVRIYFATYDASDPTFPNHLIRLSATNGSADLIMPGSLPSGDKMASINSGLTVTAGEVVTIESFDGGDETKPGYGWVAPDTSKMCGGSTGQHISAEALITWATQKAAGEPLVSLQCWGDSGGSSQDDFNDYFVIVSYVPASQATSVSPSPSLSPSPSPSRAASPSPSSALQASPSPSVKASTAASASVAASPRVTMPEGSALPDAGVFEVTVGAIGVGLVFVLLGVLGLLVL